MTAYLPAAAYLPHSTPMLLLEQVLDVGEECVHCRTTVSNESVLAPFLRADGSADNSLPGWFALEIMAQAIGVWSGYHRRVRGDEQICLGMLLSARMLRSHQPTFAYGSVLDVRMTLLMQDEKFGSFDGEILCAGECLATARLNTYQPEPQEFQQIFQQDGVA